MNAVEPVGAIVTFTCVVNITELSGIFVAYLWTVGGLTLDGGSNQDVETNGTLRIGFRQVMALKDYTGGVSVQCEVLTSSATSRPRSNNATLTAYGEITIIKNSTKGAEGADASGEFQLDASILFIHALTILQ